MREGDSQLGRTDNGFASSLQQLQVFVGDNEFGGLNNADIW